MKNFLVTQINPNVSVATARHSLYSHPPPIIQQYPTQRLNYHQPQSIAHAPYYTHTHISQHQQHENKLGEQSEPARTFLINAHKVGIRAMDTITLSLRNAEDHRTYVKYSKVRVDLINNIVF